MSGAKRADQAPDVIKTLPLSAIKNRAQADVVDGGKGGGGGGGQAGRAGVDRGKGWGSGVGRGRRYQIKMAQEIKSGLDMMCWSLVNGRVFYCSTEAWHGAGESTSEPNRAPSDPSHRVCVCVCGGGGGGGRRGQRRRGAVRLECVCVCVRETERETERGGGEGERGEGGR